MGLADVIIAVTAAIYHFILYLTTRALTLCPNSGSSLPNPPQSFLNNLTTPQEGYSVPEGLLNHPLHFDVAGEES